MTGSELLRALGGIAAADHAQELTFSKNKLCFVLEYSTIPSPQEEAEKIKSQFGIAAFSLSSVDDVITGDSAKFLILQFPGTERTLSARAMYEIASVLRDHLGLVSCEPDVGARVYAEPDARTLKNAQAEGVIVDLWCWSKAIPPADKKWALKSIRADKAWTLSPKMGEGVIIGQPDTGVADHPELEPGALDPTKSKNILEGGTNPKDPLLKDVPNPGHGTATSSVAVSRNRGEIVGSAPGAALAPIRCINDVKIFDAAPVAAAVRHAHMANCDIITMSLGGTPSRLLKAVIADAVADGKIVIAAAGNCVGIVVYPAYDTNVIAVAGVDEHDKPWVGSSSGNSVDISAPAENVYVARRTPQDNGVPAVDGGQGTSFATALTAGVAALWLAHFGQAAIRDEAKRRKVTVQALFRTALRQSARRPASWDATRYGAGIIDAEALLRLNLSKIPTPAAKPEISGAVEEIMRLAARGETVEGFDWAANGAEAGLLAITALRYARHAAAGVELIGGGVLTPSSALEAKAPAVLRSLFGRASGEELAPSVWNQQIDIARTMRTIAKTPGGGTESVSSISLEDAGRRLSQKTTRTKLVEVMGEALDALPPTTDDATRARKRLSKDLDAALGKVAELGPAAKLSEHERISLEALVRVHDRPAFRVRNSLINPQDPLLGEWGNLILTVPHLVTPVIQAVGRIDRGSTHIGTGFVIASGMIMTNRHVLEHIAEEIKGTGKPSRWIFRERPGINFADDAHGDDLRFEIEEVVATGPNRINDVVNFAHLDMAILKVKTTSLTGKALPAPIPVIANQQLAHEGREIVVAGYPARPRNDAMRDPATGTIREDVRTRLGKIFGVAYSVKYLSPGEIAKGLGEVSGDNRAWIFSHDATTLGGNSGSWIINFGDPFGVVGLHFGGGTLRANYAHSIKAVKVSALLAEAGLGSVRWV